MKAITTTLYVCGGLMVAAAVMGAVDYSAASKKGTLDKLYKEEGAASLPFVDKEITFEDYSRAAIEMPVETKVEPVAEIKPVKKVSPNKTVAHSGSYRRAKKKKKIELADFSRKAISPRLILNDSLAVKK